MNNPEKNAVAKLGYTITMVIVGTAILYCMKTLLHVLIKSAIIVAVAVVCYYIYMAVNGK